MVWCCFESTTILELGPDSQIFSRSMIAFTFDYVSCAAYLQAAEVRRLAFLNIVNN